MTAINVNDCRKKCFHSVRCFLACWNGITGECRLSDVIFTGKYKEADTNGELIDCFTSEAEDIVVGKSIQGTPHERRYLNRVVENLIDGFYSHDMNDCYLSTKDGV